MSELELVPRLLLAAALGAVLGWERERKRKPAGLRTHALVALAAALVLVTTQETTDAALDPSSTGRVVQGIVTGVGFIGAGAILRLEGAVVGITTAASIWMAAALGVVAGLGAYVLAAVGIVLSFAILFFLRELEPGE